MKLPGTTCFKRDSYTRHLIANPGPLCWVFSNKRSELEISEKIERLTTVVFVWNDFQVQKFKEFLAQRPEVGKPGGG